MTLFIYLFFFIYLSLSPSVFTLYSPSSGVITLTPSNFDNLVLKSDDIWLVEFFAPWCGHCKSLAPEYSKAADALKGIIKVGAVDADEHKDIGGKYGVKGFPTIKIFANKKSSPIDYNGPRTASGIVDTVFRELKKEADRRLNGGSKSSDSGSSHVIEVTDDNFNKKVLESKEPFLLEFFVPWCGHCKRLEPVWKSVAAEVNSEKLPIKIGAIDATVNQLSAEKYNIKGFPTIKLFVNGQVEDYEGGRSKDDILQYIRNKVSEKSPPPELMQLINQKVLDENCASAQLCVISFLPHILDCDSKCRNSYLDVLKKISEKHKKHAYLWSEAVQQPDLESTLGVGGFGYPAMAVLNVRKMKYTLLRGPFSAEGIHEFLRDLSYGKGSSVPVPGAKLPSIANVEPWDGKDGVPPVSHDDEL